MISIRSAHERGHTQVDWLDSWHTFSFAGYHDPKHMGFRALRVINDDVFAPGTGFGMHPHRDMEIITVVLAGALEHRDSLGTGAIIRPGEIQRMTAGTGILHSEFNPSEQEPVHLLQIWILPEQKGLQPGYEQRAFADDLLRARWRLLAARDGGDGALTVHQDVSLLATALTAGEQVAYTAKPDRHLWLHVATGDVELNNRHLSAGDGAAISDEAQVELRAANDARCLLFDLA